MPIHCPVSLGATNQEEFSRIDYHVMRLAFERQNALGRLCDEVIYQNDLAARITSAGLGTIHKELPIIVSHGDFAKPYSIDLVVGAGSIYELKTATSFAPEHVSQLLNYLFLCDATHGKLINFRPPKVQSKFVNTTLTPEERKRFVLHTERWQEDTEAARRLRDCFHDLLQDWGAFLELPLYMEALTHLMGGPDRVLRMAPLVRDGIPLGSQKLHVIAPEAAFRLTAMPGNAENYEHQLRCLLNLTPLHSIQWINMDKHDIHFVTLSK
jgi:GxxExxY protein